MKARGRVPFKVCLPFQSKRSLNGFQIRKSKKVNLQELKIKKENRAVVVWIRIKDNYYLLQPWSYSHSHHLYLLHILRYSLIFI